MPGSQLFQVPSSRKRTAPYLCPLTANRIDVWPYTRSECAGVVKKIRKQLFSTNIYQMNRRSSKALYKKSEHIIPNIVKSAMESNRNRIGSQVISSEKPHSGEISNKASQKSRTESLPVIQASVRLDNHESISEKNLREKAPRSQKYRAVLVQSRMSVDDDIRLYGYSPPKLLLLRLEADPRD